MEYKIKLINEDVIYDIQSIEKEDGMVKIHADYIAENGTRYNRTYLIPFSSILYIKEEEEEGKKKGDKK